MTNENTEGPAPEEPTPVEVAPAADQPQTASTAAPAPASQVPSSAAPAQGRERRGVFIGRGVFLGLAGVAAAALFVLLGVGIGALLWTGGHHGERAEVQRAVQFPEGRFPGPFSAPLRQRAVPQNQQAPSVVPNQPSKVPQQNGSGQQGAQPQPNGNNQQSTVGPVRQLLQDLLQNGNDLSPELRQLLQQLQNFLERSQQNPAPYGNQ